MIEPNDESGWLRPVAIADLPPLLALNNAHAAELSHLTAEAFATLVAGAFAALVACPVGGDGAEGPVALLLALDQDADYGSPNFVWFRDRYPRFVYVDRVVVAPDWRGRGLASALYRRLFADCQAAGHDTVVCEVNSDPPNPASDAFHAGLDFRPVGAADLPERGKSVRYLLRPLGGAADGIGPGL